MHQDMTECLVKAENSTSECKKMKIQDQRINKLCKSLWVEMVIKDICHMRLAVSSKNKGELFWCVNHLNIRQPLNILINFI